MAPQASFVPPCIAHDRAPGQIQGVLAANSALAEPAAIDEPDLDVIGLDGPIGPPEAIGRRIEADSHPQRCSGLPLRSCRLEPQSAHLGVPCDCAANPGTDGGLRPKEPSERRNGGCSSGRSRVVGYS